MGERHEPADRAEALRAFGLGTEDLSAWEHSGLPASAFDDWLTDRLARRPSGARAREVYGADDIHDFARRAILDALALGAGDRLLEIGCGGGLLLRDALASGAQATGLDHSEEMTDLACQRAPDAEIVLAAAEKLPFEDRSFTAIAMSVVFVFLAEPLAVLRECRRVLESGGRLAVYTTAPSCAAPTLRPSRWQASAASTRTRSSPGSRAKADSPRSRLPTTPAANCSPLATNRPSFPYTVECRRPGEVSPKPIRLPTARRRQLGHGYRPCAWQKRLHRALGEWQAPVDRRDRRRRGGGPGQTRPCRGAVGGGLVSPRARRDASGRRPREGERPAARGARGPRGGDPRGLGRIEVCRGALARRAAGAAPAPSQQLGAAAEVLARLCDDQSRIVQANALEGLVRLAEEHPELIETAEAAMTRAAQSPHPSVRARARPLLR